MQDFDYISMADNIRRTTDPALLLVVCLFDSLHRVLVSMKDPRFISFFLSDTAMLHLRLKDDESFRREIKGGIREARRELYDLATKVENRQRDLFDNWFMERNQRLDQLNEFNDKIYVDFSRNLDFMQTKGLLTTEMQGIWEKLSVLAKLSREDQRNTWSVRRALDSVGWFFKDIRGSYSMLRLHTLGGKKLYLVHLEDMMKRPDEAMFDVLAGDRNEWAKSTVSYYTLVNLSTLLVIASTGRNP